MLAKSWDSNLCPQQPETYSGIEVAAILKRKYFGPIHSSQFCHYLALQKKNYDNHFNIRFQFLFYPLFNSGLIAFAKMRWWCYAFEPFWRAIFALILPFLTSGSDLEAWPDCWAFVEFLRAPIPRKGSGSTTTARWGAVAKCITITKFV